MKKWSLAAALLLIAVPLGAHDTWLAPNVHAVRTGARVDFSMTSGMAFPARGTAIQRDRIAEDSVRLAGSTRAMNIVNVGKSALMLTSKLDEAGVATAWVRLKPRTLSLTPELVKEYLEEIGAADSVRARYMAQPAPRKWREEYTKHAKTFVRVGVPQSDDSWSKAVGLALEIIPMRDPTKLRRGDTLSVKVLRLGSPAALFPVGFVAAGQKEGHLVRTNAEGIASFRLDRGGQWLIRGTDIRATSKADLDWESDFSTVVLAVRP